MKRFLLLSLAAALAAASPLMAQPQVAPTWLTLPQQSVASTDDALSILVNPAGLGVGGDGTLYFLAPYQSNGHFEDWGFVAGDGLGFAMEAYRHDPTGSRRRYTWGAGFGDHGTYLGFAYSWTTGLDRQNTWDFGLMERPFNFLSFGAVARNANQPRLRGVKLPVAWDLGLAFRPISAFGLNARKGGDRVTLTYDAYLRGFDELPGQAKQGYFDEVDMKIGAHFEIIPGLSGHLDFSPEIEGNLAHSSRVSGGLSFSFGKMDIGGYQTSGNGSGVGYIMSRQHYHRTWFRPKHHKFIEMQLNGPVVEEKPHFFLFAPRYRTIAETHQQLDQYGKDPEVTGLLLKIGDVQAGWGKMQEIRGSLAKFKANGKKVAVYMESAGNGEYYLASVADKIWLAPAGDVDLAGLSATTYYLKGTLAKIGVEPEMAHIGAYKSASDMYMRETMSNAEREATGAVLDDIYSQFTTDIAAGRGWEHSAVVERIDRGPFTAAEALKEGLVDSLVYEDEVGDLVKTLDDAEPEIVQEAEYTSHIDPEADWFDLRKKSVAIIYAAGEITSGESSGGGLFGSSTIGSVSISEALRNAREDDEIAAVVFRIDSPGGSALASDMIMREVKRYRDDEKPIIVSMSDVAGSGGYYIACMADTIVALPGTITGSIGVIGGKFSFGALEKKLGIGRETLTRGKNADIYSSDRAFTDEEWKKLGSQIGQTYNIFLDRVAAGRGMDTASVNQIGQGRIWSGTSAKNRGLVDVEGGLDLALKLAARAGGLKEGEEFEVKVYPDHGELELSARWKMVVRSSIPEPLLKIADVAAEQNRRRDGEAMMLMPINLEIK